MSEPPCALALAILTLATANGHRPGLLSQCTPHSSNQHVHGREKKTSHQVWDWECFDPITTFRRPPNGTPQHSWSTTNQWPRPPPNRKPNRIRSPDRSHSNRIAHLSPGGGPAARRVEEHGLPACAHPRAAHDSDWKIFSISPKRSHPLDRRATKYGEHQVEKHQAEWANKKDPLGTTT